MIGLACTQEFLEGAGDTGAVYVSLGTVCSIGAEEFRELAAAMSSLPTRVVWKVGRDDLPAGLDLGNLGLGSNVKVVQWAPQNDLLGSGHLRAFLTHGGINGLYEVAPLSKLCLLHRPRLVVVHQTMAPTQACANCRRSLVFVQSASKPQRDIIESRDLDWPSVVPGCVSCGANRGDSPDSGPAGQCHEGGAQGLWAGCQPQGRPEGQQHWHGA